MSSYKGGKVEMEKKFGFNGKKHNYLKLLLMDILKMYRIELFLMELAALYLLHLQITLFLEILVGK